MRDVLVAGIAVLGLVFGGFALLRSGGDDPPADETADTGVLAAEAGDQAQLTTGGGEEIAASAEADTSSLAVDGAVATRVDESASVFQVIQVTVDGTTQVARSFEQTIFRDPANRGALTSSGVRVEIDRGPLSLGVLKGSNRARGGNVTISGCMSDGSCPFTMALGAPSMVGYEAMEAGLDALTFQAPEIQWTFGEGVVDWNFDRGSGGGRSAGPPLGVPVAGSVEGYLSADAFNALTGGPAGNALPLAAYGFVASPDPSSRNPVSYGPVTVAGTFSEGSGDLLNALLTGAGLGTVQVYGCNVDNCFDFWTLTDTVITEMTLSSNRGVPMTFDYGSLVIEHNGPNGQAGVEITR